MASSGWQGYKVVQDATHGLGTWPYMSVDLRIDSISHSGTTLTFTCVVRAKCTSGYINYNNATVSVTGNRTSKLLDLNLSAGQVSGNTGTFECTISNVSATTTSKQVTVSLSAGSVVSGSAKFTLSFNASTTAPTGLYINNISSTWNSVSGTIGLSSYGTGSGTKSLQMLVLEQTYVAGTPNRHETASSGAMSASLTVTNNSTVGTGGSIDIKGCGLYYTGVYASNGSVASRLAGPTTYTPPAPVVFNYVRVGETTQWQVTLTGDPNKNVSNYTAAQLTRSMRYKIDDGSWVNVESAEVKAIDATTLVNITIPYGSTATIEGWMTYQNLNSEVSTITITNGDAPVHLYGSVNGESQLIRHLYGSVNGRSKKIVKLYASVGGVAKLIHIDTGA